MKNGNILMGLLGGLLIVLIIAIIAAVVLYVLQAIGLSRIAQKEGVDLHWLAWIPIANIVLIAKLVEEDVHESIRGKFTIISIIAIAVGLILGRSVGILSYLPQVVMLYSFYFIAKRYSKNEMAHIIIAVITLGISVPIQLFRIKDRGKVTKQAA